MVSSDIRKRISANRAYAYAVYLNICNMIAAVWRDGKDLIRTLSHKNAAAGTDGTAGAGGGADGEGPRVLLPDDGEGGEASFTDVELDAVGVVFNFHGLRFTGLNGFLHFRLTGNAVLPV